MTNMEEYLARIAEERQGLVVRRLQRGDKVSKNFYQGNFVYEVDDVDVYHRIGSFSSSDDNSLSDYVLNVGRSLCIDEIKRQQVFPPTARDEKGKLLPAPFSRAVDNGFGECTEKAMLVLLALQECIPTFMIKGLLSHLSLGTAINHAYNVAIFEGDGYLIDAQNSVFVKADGVRRECPYIVPVERIRDDAFVILEQYSAGRMYTLLH